MARKRHSYPSIPTTNWWILRERFTNTVPGKVTPQYLASVLAIEQKSAEKNILPALRALGLVRKDGTTTSRATRWRDDTDYPQVCREIREEAYPQDLLDAVPDPSSERMAAERWFMNTTGCGKDQGKRLARTYALLMSADPSATRIRTRQRNKNVHAKAKGTPPRQPISRKGQPVEEQHKRPDASGHSALLDDRPLAVEMPDVRLNLEIRIDSSVSPQQIDQIFASMAKHLYRRADEGR